MPKHHGFVDLVSSPAQSPQAAGEQTRNGEPLTVGVTASVDWTEQMQDRLCQGYAGMGFNLLDRPIGFVFSQREAGSAQQQVRRASRSNLITTLGQIAEVQLRGPAAADPLQLLVRRPFLSANPTNPNDRQRYLMYDLRSNEAHPFINARSAMRNEVLTRMPGVDTRELFTLVARSLFVVVGKVNSNVDIRGIRDNLAGASLRLGYVSFRQPEIHRAYNTPLLKSTGDVSGLPTQ